MSLIKKITNGWRWIACIAICILVLIIANQLALQPVALNISIPNNTIRLGEEVVLRVEIANNSWRDIYINRLLYFSLNPRLDFGLRSFDLEIVSPSGDELIRHCRVDASFTPSELLLLRAKTSFVTTISLDHCYSFEEVGNYRLLGIYGNSYSPDGFENVWTGFVESDVIEIQVTPRD